MNSLRTIDFDGLVFEAQVLEVTLDGRYYAVQAYHIDTDEMHYFVCEQFSRRAEITVIYQTNEAEDADLVWGMYMDSGAGKTEAEVALDLFLDQLILAL